MRILPLVAALATTLPVFAANKTFTWVPPTANTDGSPLAAADIASYRLRCQDQPDVTVPGGNTVSFVKDYAPGSYTCALFTVHRNGNISGPSNAVSFTVPQPTPNAATGFSVN